MIFHSSHVIPVFFLRVMLIMYVYRTVRKVSSCGMSDVIGPVHIKERPGSEMQSRIDAEVVKLLKDAYERVKSLLKKHEKSLHTLANALLEYKTLNAEEIKRILKQGQAGAISDEVMQ
ncbi:putative peptidase M41 [Helianthus annuus]|nr:putative peptidase M41 [Helianthus annuus]